MKVSRIALSGWRSFPSKSDPTSLEELGKTNLLVGPNNVGKSNVGRFLVRVRDALRGLNLHAENPWRPEANGAYPLDLRIPTVEADHWLRGNAEIRCELDIDPTDIESPDHIPDWLVANGRLRILITLGAVEDRAALRIVPLSTAGVPLLRAHTAGLQVLVDATTYVLNQNPLQHRHRALALAVCKHLATRVLEIRAMRDVGRQGQQTVGSTNGGEILEMLRSAQKETNKQRLWSESIEDLEGWLCALLGETSVTLEVNEIGLFVTLIRQNKRFRCQLSDLGAGVSEIVMLLAYLRLRPHEPSLIIIDEPEAHLHPGAAIELVRIIAKHFPSYQLLITTHSTALIDAVDDSWQVFRALKGPEGGTAIERLSTSKDEIALLVDLGINPSQVFLARNVIWVEGPSDICYWTAIIRRAAPELLPGRDFAFVLYGGSNGAHLDLVIPQTKKRPG